MRMTYRIEQFTFTNPALPQVNWGAGPTHVVIHRQDNLGVGARAALEWGNREAAFSIHSYIDEDLCIDAMPANLQAWHVREGRKAASFGIEAGPYGRGDWRVYGIETCDDPVEAGSEQQYRLTQETRITLLLATYDVIRQFSIPTQNVLEHADLDPWTRADDLGDAIYMPDFRADLEDLLAGRTPWRTVQRNAYGRPAPVSWQTGVEPAPAPEPEPEPEPAPAPTPEPTSDPLAEVDLLVGTAQGALVQAREALRRARG